MARSDDVMRNVELGGGEAGCNFVDLGTGNSTRKIESYKRKMGLG